LTLESVEAWGRFHKGFHHVSRPAFLDSARAEIERGNLPTLAYGRARSYGDSCLNANGRLIETRLLDRIIAADWRTGVVRVEAGLTLDELLRISVPRHWFPPVSPGTKFVSIGGAVANDVHGKNHETAGTIGAHVRAIGLARSNGDLLELSPSQSGAMFAATIGGLGLTGLLLWVELQLAPIGSACFETETLPLADLDGFFRIAEEDADWGYSAAWIDCLAKGARLGRGLYMRGRHADSGGFEIHRDPSLAVPFDMPAWLLNSRSLRAFNAIYRNRPWALGRKRIHYDPFLFPLDGIHRWNRLYGRRGFFQHQCAIPTASAPGAIRKLLALTARRSEGSFLAVLKSFGSRASPGILSFPTPGATLALDFPNLGASTLALLKELADIVLESGGRLYPAKDATMSPQHFQAGYPDWRKLEAQRDPAFISDFWRRVTEIAA
jgi:FAD/FMN-containing dehydrogenase